MLLQEVSDADDGEDGQRPAQAGGLVVEDEEHEAAAADREQRVADQALPRIGAVVEGVGAESRHHEDEFQDDVRADGQSRGPGVHEAQGTVG